MDTKFHSRLARTLIVVALALSALAAAEREQGGAAQTATPYEPDTRSGSKILADGNPPLTKEIADGFGNFLAWVLEISLTPQQKQMIEQDLMSSWGHSSPQQIQGKLDMAELYRRMSVRPADQQASVRKMLQPAMLQTVTRQPDDPVAKMLLNAYQSQHASERVAAQPRTSLSTDSTLAQPATRTSAGQDAWAPDSKFGDLQFNVPTGWRQMQTPDGIVLVPNGASQNSVVIIGFLPTQTVGDPYSWFRASWANWKTQINLIDSGAPETNHNPNGFDVLRSYSRAYSPRLGNASFILAAAVAGNRVAPYFYLCNTNCGFDGYQKDFQIFELSLTLASLGSSPRPSGSKIDNSGGLKGLYTSYSMSEGHPELGTFRVRGSITYLAFFGDGNVIRFFPKEGLENFDFRSAVRSSRESCGRYQISGDRISITWGDNSTASGLRDGTKLQIGDGPFEYEPTAHSDGLTLGATYRPDRADPRLTIAFTPDGRFADAGALTAADLAFSAGTGSYRIKDNTLTLSYSTGQTVKVSFFISGDEEGSHRPSTIHVNGHALLRAGN